METQGNALFRSLRIDESIDRRSTRRRQFRANTGVVQSHCVGVRRGGFEIMVEVRRILRGLCAGGAGRRHQHSGAGGESVDLVGKVSVADPRRGHRHNPRHTVRKLNHWHRRSKQDADGSDVRIHVVDRLLWRLRRHQRCQQAQRQQQTRCGHESWCAVFLSRFSLAHRVPDPFSG